MFRVTREGSDSGSQFFGVDRKLRQGCDSEEAGVVIGRDHGSNTGEQVASLGSFGYIHAFDGVRDVFFCQLFDEFVTMQMLAVEDGKITPLAAKLPLALAQIEDDVARFEVFTCGGED